MAKGAQLSANISMAPDDGSSRQSQRNISSWTELLCGVGTEKSRQRKTVHESYYFVTPMNPVPPFGNCENVRKANRIGLKVAVKTVEESISKLSDDAKEMSTDEQLNDLKQGFLSLLHIMRATGLFMIVREDAKRRNKPTKRKAKTL